MRARVQKWGRGRHGLRRSAPLALVMLAGLVTALASAPLASAELWAQEGFVMTLEDALKRAQESNPAYRRALNQLELNGPERLQALGAYLPELSISAGTGISANRQLISTDVFGNPIQNPITEWKTSSSSSQSIQGSLTLFEWGARSAEWAAQKARARGRNAAASRELLSLRAAVVRAYEGAQRQLALLRVEEELLASRRLDLETTRRRFELAGASRVDVLTAELNVQQQEQRIEEARGQLERALLTLRTTIGDPELGTFQVVAALPEPFDPTGLEEGALVERSLASNPALVQQEEELAVSRAETRSARARRWPGLSISFSARQSTFGDELRAAFDPYPDRSRSGGASLGISLPLFPRFDSKARVVQAEVGLANAEESLREARLQTEELVRGRFIALQTAFRSYQISLRSREIAQERLRLAREQYRLGSRTFVELQQDIDAAAQAERAVITQLFTLTGALVDLEEAVGGEIG